MKNAKRHSNTAGTSKATNRQSGTLCLNTPMLKKAERYSSNSTPQAKTTSKRESLLAGTTDTTGKTSTKKAPSKRNSERNSPKRKSTKNSSGNATKRNAGNTTKPKNAKRKSKHSCDHSYELSVPYALEGKTTVKEYYKGKTHQDRYVCHWKCTKCTDRTITWSTDHKIPVFKYEPIK